VTARRPNRGAIRDQRVPPLGVLPAASDVVNCSASPSYVLAASVHRPTGATAKPQSAVRPSTPSLVSQITSELTSGAAAEGGPTDRHPGANRPPRVSARGPGPDPPAPDPVPARPSPATPSQDDKNGDANIKVLLPTTSPSSSACVAAALRETRQDGRATSPVAVAVRAANLTVLQHSWRKARAGLSRTAVPLPAAAPATGRP